MMLKLMYLNRGVNMSEQDRDFYTFFLGGVGFIFVMLVIDKLNIGQYTEMAVKAVGFILESLGSVF